MRIHSPLISRLMFWRKTEDEIRDRVQTVKSALAKKRASEARVLRDVAESTGDARVLRIAAQKESEARMLLDDADLLRIIGAAREEDDSS